jgi:FkbM family methyltransferase
VIHRGLRWAAQRLPGRWVLPAVASLDLAQEIEPELPHVASLGPCRGIAVDVGANYGLYTYCLSKHYRQVVAFEPNRRASELIAAWGSPRVRLEHFGLSSSAGVATLFIPVSGGVEMRGWASLDPDNCPGAERLERLEVELRTLDSFALADVGFIKIDVEGHELDVLRGAAATIAASRPHLMIEVRSDEAKVRSLMGSWGYECRRLGDVVAGARSDSANLIFVPG